MGGGARQTVSRRQRAVQRRQAPAGVEQVGLLGDFTEQGVAFLILSLLGAAPLTAASHLGFIAGFASWTHFNRGILKWCCCNGHLAPTLENELHHLCVDKSMD